MGAVVGAIGPAIAIPSVLECVSAVILKSARCLSCRGESGGCASDGRSKRASDEQRFGRESKTRYTAHRLRNVSHEGKPPMAPNIGAVAAANRDFLPP